MKYTNENQEQYIKFSYVVRNRGECIKYLDKKKYITLDEPIIYYIDYDNKNEYIEVPANYEFDFNSSPCFGHCIVDRDEFMIALIHDRFFDKSAKLIIKDINNLSLKFKKLKKYGSGFGVEHKGEEIINYFVYNRIFADKLWKVGAMEESKEIEKINKDIKIFFGYLAIRMWGTKYFKK